jgi:hypothetical protein
MKYKADTSFSVRNIIVDARVGKFGDVILDQYDLDDDWREWIGEGREITIPDVDYLRWLEERLMELLSK